MIRSAMMSQARKLANDNDATNPFHSDAQLEALLDNWSIDLATYLMFPRTQQTISFAVGDGGATNTKNLNTDCLLILRVNWEPTSGDNYVRLLPSNEQEMNANFPSWRNYSNGSPTYYVILDSVAEAAAAFPQRKITTDKPTDTAKTMRIEYVQAPAASTATTQSPVFPPQYHLTGVYYMAWQMYLPRNAEKADMYMKLYLVERRKQRDFSMRESQENLGFAWDMAQTW